MSTRIPLPGNMIDTLMKGVDTGSSMYSRIMQPILAREKQKQDLQLANDRQKQLESHFQAQLGLSKDAASRAAQAAMDNHKIALNKLDPTFEAKQYQALENYWKSRGNNNRNTAPNSQMTQNTIPTQEMGEGMGMYSHQGLDEASQTPQVAMQENTNNTNLGAPDLELMKAHPMFRGWYKKHYGVDPLAPVAQTPEDKQAMALDLFKQKENIKQVTKTGSGETLTAPIKTKYQNVIGGVTSARPILKKLIEETNKGNIPGQLIGSLFKRDAQANYKGEVSTLLDGVRNAYTIPNTDSGTAKAEDKVLRKPGESDSNYATRLQSILDQMDLREKDARIKLNAGNITAGTVHLVGPNGEDYDVPESEVSAILSENPGVRRG